MTIKVIIDWQTVRVRNFEDRAEAFAYAQEMRFSGFRVEVQ